MTRACREETRSQRRFDHQCTSLSSLRKGQYTVLATIGVSSMGLGLDEASLLALMVESVFFGLFTMLFAITIYILFFRQRKLQRLNKPILSVSIVMYVVAFAHIIISTRRVVLAFINERDELGGPDAYFAATSDTLYLFKVGLYTIQTLVGDAFLIYRLSVVWSGDKRLVYPAILLLLGGFVCGLVAEIYAGLSTSPTGAVFVPRLKHWILAFFSLTLFTNFSCTALLAFKLWWTERQLAGFETSNRLLPVMAIIIESGALYSACLISLMASYATESWAGYIALDITTQMIGIVFSLIIVRIGLGLSTEETLHRGRLTTYTQGINQEVPMRPLVVEIAQSKSVHDERGESFLRIQSGDSTLLKVDVSDDKQNVTFEV
ncbi:hypothetical protein DFH11DRAFT_1611931 [Phellopilus nigrolimitatus]|nr:hypothetical protein DFH11DRAFT_1611931 [Phellopilus nigrolimitatus]